MLAGAGLGDDARLAHALGEQDLAEAIVDLVRAGVVELLALEIDLRAAEMLGQPLRRNRAGSAGRHSGSTRSLELGLEGRIGLGLVPVPLADRGSAASAFRRRSGRRKCRTCPARRVRCGRNWVRPACSSAALLASEAVRRTLRALPRVAATASEKCFDQRRLLDARRAFDARRDVDAGRVGKPQRLADIGRR